MVYFFFFNSQFLMHFYHAVLVFIFFDFYSMLLFQSEVPVLFCFSTKQNREKYRYERITKPLHVMTLHYINTNKYNCTKSVIETLKLSCVCFMIANIPWNIYIVYQIRLSMYAIYNTFVEAHFWNSISNINRRNIWLNSTMISKFIRLFATYRIALLLCSFSVKTHDSFIDSFWIVLRVFGIAITRWKVSITIIWQCVILWLSNR